MARLDARSWWAAAAAVIGAGLGVGAAVAAGAAMRHDRSSGPQPMLALPPPTAQLALPAPDARPRRGRGWLILLFVALAAVAATYVSNQMQAQHKLEQKAMLLTAGDPERGRIAAGRRPCGQCHEIPGVRGAKAMVGPPLTHFSRRVFIGGRLNNTPDNLVGWIKNPHAYDPQSAMPPMGLTDREARDIAAYLYTLK